MATFQRESEAGLFPTAAGHYLSGRPPYADRLFRLIDGGSDDLGSGLGHFRIVTIGRSFHWMDRAETLRRLNGLIARRNSSVRWPL
jgi:hypothetical protein